MVIEPHGILMEGDALKYEFGFRGVFETLTIHEDAFIITPFQIFAGRLRELMRGKERLGSVGIGVGETVLDAEVLGDAAIRAKDLSRAHLKEKLEAIRLRKLEEFEELADRASLVPRDVRERVRLEVADLMDPDTVEWAIERFTELTKRVRIVDTEYVAKNILGPEGTVVFEGSQGVLLDRWYGFHPYTTKVRTIPETALSLIRECEYAGEIENLGVLRAYHTRHGAGPFVAESAELTKQLPDATNGEHKWQGNFRVGYFDAVAAKYAIEACGGAKALDGLVITCVDRLPALGTPFFVEVYRNEGAPELIEKDLFQTSGDGFIERIIVRHGEDAAQLKRQEKLGQALRQCAPKLAEFRKDLLPDEFTRMLGVPVVAISVGPTEKDKIEISKK
jgi:adenylosuccinate synthase